jgi:hypothetical protein
MRIYRLFVVFALWSVATLAAQNIPDACGSTVQEPSVTSLRALNAAEMSFAGQHRRFGSVSELLSDANAKKLLRPFGSASDALPGYTVHSVVSADGKSYVITLTKVNGALRRIWGDHI